MDLDTTVNNNPASISEILDFIFDLIGGVVDLMKNINLFSSVSLFDFCIVLFVMTVVITYLVNVAKSPDVMSAGEEARLAERRNRDDYNEYVHSRRQRVSRVKYRSYRDWKEFNGR